MNSKGLPEIFLAITVNTHGQVLIVHRVKEEEGTGKTVLSWVFPGGGRDHVDETGDEVIVRELLEETGYKVNPGRVISEREHPNFPVYIYYISCSLAEPVQIIDSSDPEVENAKWVKPGELSDYFTSDFDSKVNEALAKI